MTRGLSEYLFAKHALSNWPKRPIPDGLTRHYSAFFTCSQRFIGHLAVVNRFASNYLDDFDCLPSNQVVGSSNLSGRAKKNGTTRVPFLFLARPENIRTRISNRGARSLTTDARKVTSEARNQFRRTSSRIARRNTVFLPGIRSPSTLWS